jgi:hypothetical protein
MAQCKTAAVTDRARYTFADLPRVAQVQLAGIGPVLLGAVIGLMLGETATGYWILTGLSVFGGIAGGLEHRTIRGALIRGLVTGVCFGTGIVVAHAVSGDRALATVPSPLVLLIVSAALGGAVLASVGWWLGARGQ